MRGLGREGFMGRSRLTEGGFSAFVLMEGFRPRAGGQVRAR